MRLSFDVAKKQCNVLVVHRNCALEVSPGVLAEF